MDKDKTMTGGGNGARRAAARAVVLLVVITAVGAALRFAVLGFSMAGEEAAALALAGTSGFGVLIAAARSTAQQPLYYVIARVWGLIFGHNLIALRVLSAILGTLWIPLVYVLGARLLRSRNAGAAAAALAALAPLAVFVSRFAGPYALFVALVLATNIAFLSLMNEKIKPRALAWYAVLAATMVFTHAHGAAIVVFHLVFAYSQRKQPVSRLFGRAAAVSTPVLIAFLMWGGRAFPLTHEAMSPPLLPAGIERLQYFLFLISPGMAFAPVPAPALAREAFTTLFVFSLFFALLGLVWARRLRGGDDTPARFLTGYLIIPILLCVPTMMLAQSPPMWWHAAYLAPAVWLLFARTLTGGRSAAARWLAAAALLIINITGLQAVLRAPAFPYDWNRAARHIRARAHPREPLLNLVPYQQSRINNHYFIKNGLRAAPVRTVNQGREIALAPDVLIAGMAYGTDCFWVLHELGRKDEEPGEEMLNAYFQITNGRTFRGPFTAPALRVARLCLKPDARYLRALPDGKFVEFLMMPPHEGGDLERRFERVAFFFDSGSLDLAARELRQVEKKYGKRPDVSLTLCAVEIERGNKSDSRAAFERAARCVRAVRGGDRRQAGALLGEALFHLGRLGDAAQFDRALPLLASAAGDKNFCRGDNRDRCTRAAYLAGEIHLRKQNPGPAARYFKKAAANPETGATAVYNLGLIYVQQKNYKTALEYLPTLLRHERYGPAASFLIGVSLYELGRFRQAEPHLNAVLQHPEYGKQAQQILAEIKKKTAPISEKKN